MNPLPGLLLAAQSPSSLTRIAAETALQELRSTSPQAFLTQLSTALLHDSVHVESRELAGIYIKNTLKNSTQDPALIELWESFPENIRQPIRENTLSTLACPHQRIRNSAAQAVACIVSLDLPSGRWGEVLSILIKNASNVNEEFKEASLMTLGYIYEQLPEGVISQNSINSALSPIVDCLTGQGQSLGTLIVALRALKNSLKLIRENMSNRIEREYLVKALGTCCSHPTTEIRTEALKVLCEIAANYYEYLENELFFFGSITFGAIGHGETPNALLAIEFWTIIANHESDLLAEGEFAPKWYTAVAQENLLTLLLLKVNERTHSEEED